MNCHFVNCFATCIVVFSNAWLFFIKYTVILSNALSFCQILCHFVKCIIVLSDALSFCLMNCNFVKCFVKCFVLLSNAFSFFSNAGLFLSYTLSLCEDIIVLRFLHCYILTVLINCICHGNFRGISLLLDLSCKR